MKKWAFLNELKPNLLEKLHSFFSNRKGKGFSQYFVLCCSGQDCYYTMCQAGHGASYA